MGYASINFNEFKVDETPKKRQGDRVNRFRKELQRCKIEFTEYMTIGVCHASMLDGVGARFHYCTPHDMRVLFTWGAHI